MHDEATIMTHLGNGVQTSMHTPIVRFREENHHDEMTFSWLTQEVQDIRNTFSLQMAKFHAGLAKSTRATVAKIGQAVRQTRTSATALLVHFT